MTDGEILVRCVAAVVHDAEGRLLLVRRGREPGRGLWSLPGGRVEAGETDAEAVAREVAEETGLAVRPGRRVGVARRAGPRGAVYDIRDYAATVVGGELQAGDDAEQARFVDAAAFAALPLVGELAAVLTRWGCLPR